MIDKQLKQAVVPNVPPIKLKLLESKKCENPNSNAAIVICNLLKMSLLLIPTKEAPKKINGISK